MNSKIMNTGNLLDILDRLKGCSTLIFMLSGVAEHSAIPEEALRGIGDLLDSIRKDFDGDISEAADYEEQRKAVVA